MLLFVLVALALVTGTAALLSLKTEPAAV
jgi:hypothetical protein